jgi:nickel transport system ATP-binding protein
MENKNILEIKNLFIELTEEKEKTLLVKDLSFSVKHGEVLGIVGESGSGKSMTCLSICGLLPGSIKIKSGEILFHDERIDDLDKEKLRKLRGNKISLILQNPISCFNPLNNIESHFKETLISHEISYTKENRMKIYNSLNEVGYDKPEDILKKYPFQLSGGMLQSIMISIALFFESSLIIADEPTTDLDLITQAQILETFNVIRKRRKCAIVLVTHDLTAVSKFSDKIIIMKDGSVCDNGSFEYLINNSKHDYTVRLFDAYHKLNAGYNKSIFRNTNSMEYKYGIT